MKFSFCARRVEQARRLRFLLGLYCSTCSCCHEVEPDLGHGLSEWWVWRCVTQFRPVLHRSQREILVQEPIWLKPFLLRGLLPRSKLLPLSFRFRCHDI